MFDHIYVGMCWYIYFQSLRLPWDYSVSCWVSVELVYVEPEDLSQCVMKGRKDPLWPFCYLLMLNHWWSKKDQFWQIWNVFNVIKDIKYTESTWMTYLLVYILHSLLLWFNTHLFPSPFGFSKVKDLTWVTVMCREAYCYLFNND